MLKKSYSKTGSTCRVTFKTPADLEANQVVVLGDFNEWCLEEHPLKKRKDGTYSTTVSLTAGQEYRFRYLIDGERWANDDQPDGVVPNRFGGEDCLVAV